MVGFLRSLFLGSPEQQAPDQPSAVTVSPPPAESAYWAGDKFDGGFGPTLIFEHDYWTLRKRSAQLFTTNLYARGIVRRLITNEVNIGLFPEARPDEGILGVDKDSLSGWSDDVEDRFALWAETPALCDFKGIQTLGQLQATVKREAYIEGDVLVVLHPDPVTGLPRVELIKGSRVRCPDKGPFGKNPPRIEHGIRLDKNGRHIAYCVDNKWIPAFGPKTGRRMAWLVYGGDKRHEEVRGMPLLGLVLQSLKEIDRYRDSVQRKAVVNSILAMFIKKSEEKVGTLPMQNAAVRKGEVQVEDSSSSTGKRSLNVSSFHPGVVFDELQVGEEPVGFHNQGTDEAFGTFEKAVIQAVAWANEIPPEILTLAFSNNYSASQAAINEFRIYLFRVWADFGTSFCTPLYQDWLLGMVLLGRIEADGMLEARDDPARQDQYYAWLSTGWYGSVKPSSDPLKQARASDAMVLKGWSNNTREARILTGTKFRQNVAMLARENAQILEANAPLREAEAGNSQPESAFALLEERLEALEGKFDE